MIFFLLFIFEGEKNDAALISQLLVGVRCPSRDGGKKSKSQHKRKKARKKRKKERGGVGRRRENERNNRERKVKRDEKGVFFFRFCFQTRAWWKNRKFCDFILNKHNKAEK